MRCVQFNAMRFLHFYFLCILFVFSIFSILFYLILKSKVERDRRGRGYWWKIVNVCRSGEVSSDVRRRRRFFNCSYIFFVFFTFLCLPAFTFEKRRIFPYIYIYIYIYICILKNFLCILNAKIMNEWSLELLRSVSLIDCVRLLSAPFFLLFACSISRNLALLVSLMVEEAF